MLETAEVVQGDDAHFDIPVEVDGVAPDITGWKFWLTVKASPDDSDAAAVFQLSTDAGTISLFNTAAGIARAHVQPAHTAGVAVGRYYIDVQAKQPNTEVSTLFRGYLKILPQITRA